MVKSWLHTPRGHSLSLEHFFASESEQTPACRDGTPTLSAVETFQYVMPSQPHTGALSNVGEVGSGAHLPPVQASQYAPSPQVFPVGLQVHGIGVPVPVDTEVDVVLATVVPPAPPPPLLLAVNVNGSPHPTAIASDNTVIVARTPIEDLARKQEHAVRKPPL